MKNAIITAGTKGIGKAIAVAFANDGINLAVCSRTAGDLDALVEELTAINPGIKVFTSVTDCTNKQQVLQFALAAENALGSIDIIVNNAGMYAYSSILDDAEDAFATQIGINLGAAYELYRYFGKKMQTARSGHIFTICSVAALNPIAEAGTYSVTKYALLGLNKVMRTEMQGHNVKVTAVIPGSTLTDSWKGMDVDAGKMVLPEDIATAIVHIYHLSDGANVDEIIIKPANGQL